MSDQSTSDRRCANPGCRADMTIDESLGSPFCYDCRRQERQIEKDAATISHLTAELERARKGPGTTICAYCEQFWVATDHPGRVAIMVAHFAVCEKHPVHQLTVKLTQAEARARVLQEEVAQWRVRHEAMIASGCPPYPWPDLDIARAATDAVGRADHQGESR